LKRFAPGLSDENGMSFDPVLCTKEKKQTNGAAFRVQMWPCREEPFAKRPGTVDRLLVKVQKDKHNISVYKSCKKVQKNIFQKLVFQLYTCSGIRLTSTLVCKFRVTRSGEFSTVGLG
jgi:hypothetical protein